MAVAERRVSKASESFSKNYLGCRIKHDKRIILKGACISNSNKLKIVKKLCD